VTLAITLSFLAHLVGDYVLQSHTMAIRKTSSWRWAATHALLYSLPFVGLLALLALPERVAPAIVVIAGTHAVIDRLAIARRWCQWYGVGYPGIWWRGAGFVEPPPFLGVWLVILVDNTFHLCINAAALAWAVGG
jgi:hypothetical protein